MPRNNPYSLSVVLDAEAMSLVATVKERESDEVVDSHTFMAADVAEKLRPMTGLYGLSKLLQDRSSDVKTGPEKLAAMKAVAEQLASGQWAKERKVGAPTVSAEVEALAQFMKITIPQAQAALRRYDKAQRDDILQNAQIVSLAKTIREAREEQDVVDLSSLQSAASEPAAETPAA